MRLELEKFIVEFLPLGINSDLLDLSVLHL